MSRLRSPATEPATTPPRVEDVLAAEGLQVETTDPDLLTDLAYTEWVLRLERGETVSPREFHERFPTISGRLERQWNLEQNLAELSSDRDWNALTMPAQAVSRGVPNEIESIGKYRVIERLGSGGQADVFRAIHPELSRDVVLKVVRPGWIETAAAFQGAVDAQLASRALDEAKLLARLSHPNVAQIFDVGQHNGLPFLVMEFVPGLTLNQYCRTHAADWVESARLLAQVARAVAAAHAQGIIHRDIKPQNIVIRSDGVPKLIDFGLAALRDAWHASGPESGLSGTLGYMSPEQAGGDPDAVGPHSDVFSLGGVLYFLLTGNTPYHPTDDHTNIYPLDVISKIKSCDWDRQALRSPPLPAPLVAICERAMESDPSRRFATANQMAQALEDFTVPRWRHHRAVAAAMVVLVAGAAVSLLATAFGPGTIETGGPPVAIAPAEPARADLKIRVHRESATIELVDAVPLPDGARISLEARIPANLALLLFTINGQGNLQHVETLPSQNEARSWRYPQDSASTVPLTGPAGTECLIVIGAKDPAGVFDQIVSGWGTVANWPALPAATVLRLAGTKVSTEQSGRDLGTPTATGLTPADRVSRELERFAGAIAPHCPLVEGIAFSHLAASE